MTLPLPDENKGKSARDLIARFQSNINVNSEAPLKPRHSFGSNERFEGDNSNPDISEAKRVPASRISNARASLEADLSALSLSRSASGNSSSSLSTTSRERAPEGSLTNAGSEQPSHNADKSKSTEEYPHPPRDAPQTPQKTVIAPSNTHDDATDVNTHGNNRDGEVNDGKAPETAETTKMETTAPNPQETSAEAGPTQEESTKDDPATTAVETPSKASAQTADAKKSSDKPSKQSETSSKSPILARTRALPKSVTSLAVSPSKSTFVENGIKPDFTKASTANTKTPRKASTSSVASSTSKAVPAKTPSRPAVSSTCKVGTGPSSAPNPARTASSPSPASTSSARLTRPTEASAKKALPPAIEHASEHTKPASSARAFKTAATPSRSAASDASTSRPTSVMSSSSTLAKTRRTPLAGPSSARRTASEETSARPSSSTSTPSSVKDGKKAMTPAEIGRLQAAASTSPPPASSRSSLAKSMSGLSVPQGSTSTPAKSPTKTTSGTSAARAVSPLSSTSPGGGSGGDTFSRLMRPTIASQAHVRSPARSPSSSSSPNAPKLPSSTLTGSSPSSGRAPTALKKARSYAGTAAAGSKAKVSKEKIAKADVQREAGNGQKGSEQVELHDDCAGEYAGRSEQEQLPEDNDIPEIPAEDEMLPAGDEIVPSHSQEGSGGHSGSDTLAPPLSTTSSSAAGTSVHTDPSIEPENAPSAATEIPQDKVFTGFGPNRPYGKIGLPTEEATPEEAANRPSDEENRILPPNLKIKQPRELQDTLERDSDHDTGNEKVEDFTDKWGRRDGTSPLPIRSPGLASVRSNEGGGETEGSEDGKSAEKKVPIWMRKGGEA